MRKQDQTECTAAAMKARDADNDDKNGSTESNATPPVHGWPGSSFENHWFSVASRPTTAQNV